MPDNLQPPTAFLELHLAGHQSGMPAFFSLADQFPHIFNGFPNLQNIFLLCRQGGEGMLSIHAKSANRTPSWPSLSQVWYASILVSILASILVCQGHQPTFETEAPLQQPAQNIITDARLGSHPHLWFDLVLVKATTDAPSHLIGDRDQPNLIEEKPQN